MSISKNWAAIAFEGITGNEIKVNGEANTGLLDVMPQLEKKIPQGINPSILLLDLLNATDAMPEHFKEVQYNERIDQKDQYSAVVIFYNDSVIAAIQVDLINK